MYRKISTFGKVREKDEALAVSAENQDKDWSA
jgi:hypothetical protein